MTYLGKQDDPEKPVLEKTSVSVPDYLQKTYTWAYLNPKTVPLLNSAPVVEMILWGNANRLIQMAVEEVEQGQMVLQAAAVYGKFSTCLAQAIGSSGQLDVIDVAPIQVQTAAKRVASYTNASVSIGDASIVQPTTYDTVICFFLLHEVPNDVKYKIVNALLASTKPGGKVCFVDYHKPVRHHILKPVMSKIFDWLEPFAKDLWEQEIEDYSDLDGLHWCKETIFGDLYQKVVVTKPL